MHEIEIERNQDYADIISENNMKDLEEIEKEVVKMDTFDK